METRQRECQRTAVHRDGPQQVHVSRQPRRECIHSQKRQDEPECAGRQREQDALRQHQPDDLSPARLPGRRGWRSPAPVPRPVPASGWQRWRMRSATRTPLPARAPAGPGARRRRFLAERRHQHAPSLVGRGELLFQASGQSRSFAPAQLAMETPRLSRAIAPY